MANFGSGTPSGPLNFTAGQTVNVVGKYFMGNLTVEGCVNPSIQSCDFADGFGISMDGCTGTTITAHNRFRNPGANAIKITNCTFSGTGVVHNTFRGRSVDTEDYILVLNSGGPTATNRFKVQYNHIDGSDPVTGLVSYPSNGGSGIHYGGVVTAGVGNTSLIYNTVLNPGPYGIHIDSGSGIILYYCIYFGQKYPNSIAPVLFAKGAGTLGGDITATLNNLHWVNASGNEVPFRAADDGTITVKEADTVTIAVDLNAVVVD